MRKIIILTLLTFAAFVLAATATRAAEIDLDAVITNLDGSAVPLSPTDKTELTLGKVCEYVLVPAVGIPGDSPTADDKVKRFFLAVKVHDKKGALTADEISLLKKLIGMAYGPLIVGRATELLDPAAVPK